MTATAHALIGISIAVIIPNPALAIPLALLSHIPCDMFPHWDAGTHFDKKDSKQLFREGLYDVIISGIASILVLYFLFPQLDPLYGLFMAFMAQFFDWITVPYYMFNMKFFPFTVFFAAQKAINTRLDKPWGIISQAVAVIIFLFAAKSLTAAM